MDLNRTKALIDNKIVWTASIPTSDADDWSAIKKKSFNFKQFAAIFVHTII